MIVQEKAYQAFLHDEFGVMFIIMKKDGEPDQPRMLYDGGEHALLYRDKDSKSLLDYLNEDVRDTLSEIDKVAFVEFEVDEEALARAYEVSVEHVDSIPLPKDLMFSMEDMYELEKFMKKKNRRTPLMYAIANGSDLETIARLLENDEDINAKNEYGATALMIAAMNNSTPEVIELLIENGADVNATDKDGDTALMFATVRDSWEVAAHYPEVIALLLENGAEVNAQTEDGMTALMLAAQYNSNPEATSLLIENGADVNAQDRNGWTALMFATRYNFSPEVVSLLLKNGADVNAKNKKSGTALMWAAENPNPEITALLLKNGANALAKDNNGKMAVDYAEGNDALKNTDVFKRLKEVSGR
ncbi:hypothetical protein FACS1894204_10400 [Synergistales bacterium]|nr:hypothetical protein FACS1894204_10400 [Synergistales bacterium]